MPNTEQSPPDSQQLQRIIDTLDAITDDVREVKRSNEYIQANGALISEALTRVSKVQADHEERLSKLEIAEREREAGVIQIPHAPRTASFTSEVGEIVGNSIRAAATAQAPVLESISNASLTQARMQKYSILSQVTTGVLLALAILAFIIFGGHH